MSKPVVNLDDLSLGTYEIGTRFSVSLGMLGQQLGLMGLGATLHVVPPGKTAYPYHRHHVSDEMFLILSGAGEYRLGDKRLPVRTGDCLGAPAGGKGHQIINTGREPLRYIGFSNNTNVDLVEYLDGGNVNVAIGATGIYYSDATFRARGQVAPMGYWDGEDTGESKQ